VALELSNTTTDGADEQKNMSPLLHWQTSKLPYTKVEGKYRWNDRQSRLQHLIVQKPLKNQGIFLRLRPSTDGGGVRPWN
jgi:hypothetical protein